MDNIFSLALKSLPSIAPLVNNILSEREVAGGESYKNIVDDLMENTIKALFGSLSTDKSFDKIKNTIKGFLIKPEWLNKPALSEWVESYDVRKVLKLVSLNSFINKPNEVELYDYLLVTYIKKTGEDKQYAQSIILAIIDIIKNHLLNSVKDNVKHSLDIEQYRLINSKLHEINETSTKSAMATNETLTLTRENNETLNVLLEIARGFSNSSHLKVDDIPAAQVAQIERSTANTILSGEIDAAKDKIDNDPKFALIQLFELKKRHWENASEYNKFRILSNIGTSFYKQGESETAAEYFILAEKFAENNDKALRNSALAYLIIGDYSTAKQKAEKSCELDPSEAQGFALLVHAYSSINASVEFEKLIPQMHKDNPECCFALSTAYRKNNNFELSYKWIEKAYNLNSTHLPYMATFATAILEELFKDEAVIYGRQFTNETIETLDKAQEIFESIWSLTYGNYLSKLYVSSGLNLGTIYRLRSNEQKLEKHIIELLSVDESNNDILKFVSQVYSERGNHELAIKYLESISGNDQLIEFIKSESYAALNNHVKAQKIVEKINIDELSERQRLLLSEFKIRLQIKLNDKIDLNSLINDFLNENQHDSLAAVLASKILRENNFQDRSLEVALNALEKSSTSYVDKLLIADYLYEAGMFNEAIPYLKDIINSGIDSRLLRKYIICLFNENKLSTLDSLLKSLPSSTLSHPFFLRISILHHIKVGSLEISLEQFSEYFAIGEEDLEMRLHWLTVLMRSDNEEKANDYLGSCPEFEDSLPILRMQLSHFLKKFGHTEKALKIAYSVCSIPRQDMDVHTAYLGLFLFNQDIECDIDVVQVDSYFEIQNDVGEKQSFIVVSGPKTTHENEFIATHKTVEKFLGKKTGDKVQITYGNLVTSEWTVSLVQSKYIYLFNKILANFNRWQPESDALAPINVIKKDGKFDFNDLFKSVDLAHERASSILSEYKNNILPIPMISRLLGKNPLDVWLSLISIENLFVRCCNGDPQEKEAALELMPKTKSIIVDPLTLFSTYLFNAHIELASFFETIGITQSSIDFFEAYLSENKDNSVCGSLGKNDSGYTWYEKNQEYLKLHISKIENFLVWTKTNCKIIPAIPSNDVESKNYSIIIKSLGSSFIDTIYAASGTGWPLFSDDLGLRMIANNYFEVNGFWSQIIFMHLLHTDNMTLKSYCSLIGHLVRGNFTWTSVDSDLIMFSIETDTSIGSDNYPYFISTLKEAEISSALNLSAQLIIKLWGMSHALRVRVTNLLLDSVAHNKGDNLKSILNFFISLVNYISPFSKREYMDNIRSWASMRFILLNDSLT